MPTTTTVEAIVRQATELANHDDPAAAAAKLIGMVGADRHLLEDARDQVAAQLHHRVDDFEATATLTLLNRALARIPRTDPLDWRVRWSRHRKP